MRPTQQYRLQHAEILGLATQLQALDAAALSHEHTTVWRLLAQLCGKLMYHLALEEGAVYPRLLEHEDHQVRALAGRFSAEVTEFRRQFEVFMRRWVHTDEIRNDPERFLAESRQLFNHLRRTMDDEDARIYALIDTLDSAPLPIAIRR